MKCPISKEGCYGRSCRFWNERTDDCIFNKIGISAIQTAINTYEIRKVLCEQSEQIEEVLCKQQNNSNL